MIRTASLLVALAGLAFPAAAAPGDRLVSVGGAVTEIVYALGAGDRLVGVDTTSLYPPAVDALPKVGYLRALTAEGLLSLRPGLVLAAQEAGPASALTQLVQAGTPVTTIGVDLLPASIPARIRAVGAALDLPAQADAMALAFAEDLTAVTGAAARVTNRPRVLFLLSASGGAILASGRNTAADAVIAAAGGENAIRSYDGYKPASSEAVAAADPAVILLTTQTFDAIGGMAKIKLLPGVAATSAARDNRILRYDSAYLLSLGPRTAHALRELAVALAPNAQIPTLPRRPWTSAE